MQKLIRKIAHIGYLKKLIIKFSSLISPNILEDILSIALLSHDFEQISLASAHETREKLWASTLKRFEDSPVLYLEFGVWEGYSIDFISKLNTNSDSVFVGFDSFQGLPHDWVPEIGKGAFNVDGNIPNIPDTRVKFVTGWFQNTLPEYLQNLQPKNANLVVHFDADLYSATLYCLMMLDTLKIPYSAIFDEFNDGESRALRNYIQATSASVEFTGKVGDYLHVGCRITPSKVYQPG